MHVTLVNPPFTFMRESDVILSQCVGLLSLAAYLERAGHQVTVIDALGAGRERRRWEPDGVLCVGLEDEEIVARVPANTGLIGIAGPFSTLALTCHRIAAMLRERFPAVPLVLGGVYPSSQPEVAARASVDYLVVGEGERPLLALVERLSNGTTGRLPTGVVDLRSPESLEAAKADAVRELDSLPAPSRAHLPFGEYLAHSPRNLHAGRIASIVTSRGCPFRCDFCSVHSVCGYKWRPRSPAHVLAEIDELTGRWGVDVLEIEDDNFTLQRERALEILAGIEERNAGGRNIGWMAPNGLRIDTLDNELLAAMARSGCLGINLALEHGDPDVLKAMNKRLDRDKALIVAALVHRYRIPCGVFLIVGYPGETKERFENGLAFYRRLKAVAPSLEFKPFFAQPYPGTALLRNAVAEGLLPSDAFQTPESLRRLSTSQSIWLETSDFDAREVRRRRDRILWTVDPSRFLVMKALDRLPPAATNVARTVLQGARAVRRRLREPAPSGRRNSDRQ